MSFLTRVFDALDIFFDNSSNGFTSDNIQGAIEELNNSIGEAGFPFREFACAQLPLDLSCVSTLDGGEIGLIYKKTTCADGGTL